MNDQWTVHPVVRYWTVQRRQWYGLDWVRDADGKPKRFFTEEAAREACERRNGAPAFIDRVDR